MPSTWANLLLPITPDVGRRAGLERALREAVRGGRLTPGTRLPPSRTLARELGVARGTVVEAYSQLVAEGFLTARQGSGTAVAPGAAAGPNGRRRDRRQRPLAQPMFNFHPGQPDLTSFPADRWLRALRRALRSSPPAALGYGDARGAPELRELLASYLARARGVACDADQLVTCSGFLRGFSLVCEALRLRGARRIAMEDPCVASHRDAARGAGLEVVPIEVDGQGARVELLEAVAADAVLVTPAHQLPLGSTLSPERRTALVDWARRRDTFVIEDDYDGEFRYDRQPVGALQALDPERIVYAGTASKTLAPGLRLAWLALPPALVDPVVQIKQRSDRQLPFTDELALANLIEAGDWDRHLRRMRSRYRARRDLLLRTLAEHAPAVRTLGISAGIHVLVELSDEGPTERELLARASGRDVGLYTLGPMWQRAQRRPQALVLGYGSPPEHRYRAALLALADVLNRS